MERVVNDPPNYALRRILANVWKALHLTRWGFQPERMPLERPEELIAQNFQPGQSLEKASKVG